ncbi:hypothetical protein PAPHI01_2706, partial [Pancytospora philotis]
MSVKSDHGKHPSHRDVLRTSFAYFAFGRADKMLIILLVMLLTIMKNVFSGLGRFILDSMDKKGETFEGVLVKVFAFHSGSLALNFLTDFLFERALIPYGGVISRHVLTNFLYSDSYEVNKITGTHSEYYIVEGSKAMAKINRLLILSLFSKVVHIFIDLGFIWRKDRSANKIVFCIVLVGSTAIAWIKSRRVKATLPHLSINNDYAFQREKQYAETMDNMMIVKSYCYEEESINKYRVKSKLWEYSWINYKYLCYLNDLLYSVLSAFFVCGTTTCYVYFNDRCTGKDIMLVFGVTIDILTSCTNMIGLHKSLHESIALTYNVLDYMKFQREDPSTKVRVSSFTDRIEVRNVT